MVAQGRGGGGALYVRGAARSRARCGRGYTHACVPCAFKVLAPRSTRATLNTPPPAPPTATPPPAGRLRPPPAAPAAAPPPPAPPPARQPPAPDGRRRAGAAADAAGRPAGGVTVRFLDTFWTQQQPAQPTPLVEPRTQRPTPARRPRALSAKNRNNRRVPVARWTNAAASVNKAPRVPSLASCASSLVTLTEKTECITQPEGPQATMSRECGQGQGAYPGRGGVAPRQRVVGSDGVIAGRNTTHNVRMCVCVRT